MPPRSFPGPAWMLAAAVIAAPPVAAAPSQSARTSFQRALDKLFRQPDLRGARAGLQVYDLDAGEVIYARAADDLLNPASVTKIVTAATTLVRLGPEFRFVPSV